MATARINRDAPFCSKRHRLEKRVLELGHRWPREPRMGLPLTAWDCVSSLLGFLDERGDPHGRLVGLTPGEIESEARWPGADGVLVKALRDTGWIERDPDGTFFRWHDYWTWNGRTLRDRNKKRYRQPTPPDIEALLREAGVDVPPHHFGGEQGGESSGEGSGEEPGEPAGEEGGASESGSGSESGSSIRSESGSHHHRGGSAGRSARKPAESPPEPEPEGLRGKVESALAEAAGGDPAACRKAVAEAIAAGLPLRWLLARALASPPDEGGSVFDWKRDAVAAFDEASPTPRKARRGKGFDSLADGGPQPPPRDLDAQRRREQERLQGERDRRECDAWLARPENLGRTVADWRRHRAGSVVDVEPTKQGPAAQVNPATSLAGRSGGGAR